MNLWYELYVRECCVCARMYIHAVISVVYKSYRVMISTMKSLACDLYNDILYVHVSVSVEYMSLYYCVV